MDESGGMQWVSTNFMESFSADSKGGVFEGDNR